MRPPSLPLLGLILFAGSAHTQLPSKPSGPAPMLQTVMVKEGAIVWEYAVTFYKTESRMVEQKTPDGKIETKTVTVAVPVTETKRAMLEVAKTNAKQLDGKAVTAEDLAERLKEPTSILLTVSDAPIDAFYAQFYKPETIVIVLPKPTAPIPVPEPKEGVSP